MKRIIIGSLFTLLISIAIITTINNTKVTAPTKHQTAQKANATQQNNLETYTYKITKVDHSGYYGTSTKDQTGIYFVNDNVPKGTIINEGDTVLISFPNNSYEQITNIELVKQ